MLRNRNEYIRALSGTGKAVSGVKEYIPTEIETTDQDLESELRRLYMEGE